MQVDEFRQMKEELYGEGSHNDRQTPVQVSVTIETKAGQQADELSLSYGCASH